MTTPDTYISVWYDSTSDDHAWIVDRCDADDNSETVRCFRSEEKARRFAEQYSQKTGLPVRG